MNLIKDIFLEHWNSVFFIDSFRDEQLTYGELKIKGQRNQEIL